MTKFINVYRRAGSLDLCGLYDGPEVARRFASQAMTPPDVGEYLGTIGVEARDVDGTIYIGQVDALDFEETIDVDALRREGGL